MYMAATWIRMAAMVPNTSRGFLSGLELKALLSSDRLAKTTAFSKRTIMIIAMFLASSMLRPMDICQWNMA